MGVTRLSADEVTSSVVRSLGLDGSSVGLFEPEAMAACLRRAASFLCPATPGQIVQSVTETLDGLPGWTQETKSQLQVMLDALLAYGDLLELPAEGGERAARRIFLGAPAFVPRASGSYLLVGVRPEGAALVGEELSRLIDHDRHVRAIEPREGVAVEQMVASSGLTELNPEQWLQAPRAVPAGDIVEEYIRRLQATGPSGDIEGVTIIDPSSPVTFYRGRWRPPKRSDSGPFVARRPQAFGADLWCFAAVSEGRIVQLVDLPVGPTLAPGADEAWRLQAALDAASGHPQRIRVRTGPQREVIVLDFFSPLPSWAQRRLDVVGTPLLRSAGALFSYSIRRAEVEEELRFLNEMLWTSADDASGGMRDD